MDTEASRRRGRTVKGNAVEDQGGRALSRAGRTLRWIAGAIAIGAGTIAIVVGATIGVRYLLADEPTPRSYAATLVLAAGLALLVVGTIVILHPVRWRWRLPVVGAIVALVVLEGYLVAPALLATNVLRVPVGTETPADRDVAYRDVELRTRDGLTLSAWYVPSRNGAAVVLLHGTASNKEGVLDHLVVLAEAGYGVLAPDLRGEGASDGSAMDFGWHGDADIAAAVDHLTRQPEVDPRRIGVVGISLGGMQAIGAAGSDRRIAAVVAEGVIRRVAEDLAWLPDAEGIPGAIQLAVNHVQFWLTSLLDPARPTSLAASVAASAPTRFLLVTADSDAEVRAANAIAHAAPDRVRIWTIGGAGHAGGLRQAPQAWEEHVLAFLDETLAP
jgi:uncharacterized protein